MVNLILVQIREGHSLLLPQSFPEILPNANSGGRMRREADDGTSEIKKKKNSFLPLPTSPWMPGLLVPEYFVCENLAVLK